MTKKTTGSVRRQHPVTSLRRSPIHFFSDIIFNPMYYCLFFGRTQQLFGPPVGPEIGPVVRRHRPQRRPQRRHCGACYRVLPSFNGVFFSLIQSGFIQFQETSNALLSLNCISIDLLPQPTTNDSDIPFRVVVFLYRVVLTSFRLDSLL